MKIGKEFYNERGKTLAMAGRNRFKNSAVIYFVVTLGTRALAKNCLESDSPTILIRSLI